MSAAAAITPYVSAGQFLDAIYQGVEEGWAHTFRLDRTTGERHVNWAPIGQHHRLASDAARHLDTSCIWFGPAVRSSNLGQRRGGREDCTLITALWLDVDVAGPQHAVENLPPTRAAAYQLIGDYPMPPSAIVDTGNGLQAWWFLAEPLSATEAESLLTRWGATWDELASRRGWHVDNVFDLARIMRLPATWNHKGEPREVYVTDWAPDRRFSPDDIDQWTIEPPAAPAPRAKAPVPYIGPERPGEAFNVVADPGHLLEAAGFVLDSDNSTTGERHYRAPHHRNDRGVTGATVYPDGHTTIWSETFAASSNVTTKRPYDAFGLYTFLQHGGNFTAASDELARQGYGTKASIASPAQLAAPAASSSGAASEDDDWARIELGEIASLIRSGEYQPIVPTILAVTGSIPLFYEARINSLFGESGGGKTWLALAAIAEQLRLGHHVLLVDYEDNPNGIAERLVLLGLEDEAIGRLDYRNPTTALGLGVAALQARAEEGTYSLIVIDSTGEAMAAGGTDSNADQEVATWFALVKHLTRLPGGPAVIVLDHIPKDRDAPSNYAIGSQRKRAAVSGAAYRVDTLKEPAKGKSGRLKLTVAKDRPGNRPKGTTAAEVEVDSTDVGVRLELHPSDAQAAAAAGEKFRPTVLMERVSRYLEAVPAASQRAVERAVTGKASGIRKAIECLHEEGFIALDASGYRTVNAYRAPVDNDDRVPASHRVPTASPEDGDAVVSGRVPASPCYYNTGTRDAPTTGDKNANASPVDNLDAEPDDADLF